MTGLVRPTDLDVGTATQVRKQGLGRLYDTKVDALLERDADAVLFPLRLFYGSVYFSTLLVASMLSRVGYPIMGVNILVANIALYLSGSTRCARNTCVGQRGLDVLLRCRQLDNMVMFISPSMSIVFLQTNKIQRTNTAPRQDYVPTFAMSHRSTYS